MLIYLIGMPACGKTTLGKILATQLQYDFLDLDIWICQNEGKTIAEIFENQGEAYFRKLENQYLHSLNSNQNLVIATGGGTPCFFDNINFINQSGLSIFLDVHLSIILDRMLIAEGQIRPMFHGKLNAALEEFLENLWQKRKAYYLQAKLTFRPLEEECGALIKKLELFDNQ